MHPARRLADVVVMQGTFVVIVVVQRKSAVDAAVASPAVAVVVRIGQIVATAEASVPVVFPFDAVLELLLLFVGTLIGETSSAAGGCGRRRRHRIQREERQFAERIFPPAAVEKTSRTVVQTRFESFKPLAQVAGCVFGGRVRQLILRPTLVVVTGAHVLVNRPNCLQRFDTLRAVVGAVGRLVALK